VFQLKFTCEELDAFAARFAGAAGGFVSTGFALAVLL
jgi:hypothetical protein